MLYRNIFILIFFKPFAYGFIAILCILVSQNMSLTAGANLFVILAIVQLPVWFCDMLENIDLLRKIKSDINLLTPGIQKCNYLNGLSH